MRSMRWRGVLAGALAVAFAHLPLGSVLSPGASLSERPVFAQAPQDPSLEAAPELFEVVNVSVANIDVWVTDREGQPVSGLERDDFVVLRDGEPVPISNFYAVTGGRPTTAAPPAEVEEIGRRGLDEIEALESRVADEHRLWIVLFVDNFNIDSNERKRVFPALAAFLRENVRSGAQAMIVTYDRQLEVVEPFTNSYLRLEAAMDVVSKQSGFATIRRRERVDTLQLIDRAADEGQALSYAQAYAEELMNNAEYTAAALERFLASLGGLPGRKALIHVSSGIPMTAGEEAFYAVADRFESSAPYSMIPRYDTTRRFETVVETANANRVVFYTADAAGLRGLEFGAAEYAGFVNMDLRSTLDSVVPENLQAPLRMIAHETGGQAILNQNEILRPLRAAARDFESFYSPRHRLLRPRGREVPRGQGEVGGAPARCDRASSNRLPGEVQRSSRPRDRGGGTALRAGGQPRGLQGPVGSARGSREGDLAATAAARGARRQHRAPADLAGQARDALAALLRGRQRRRRRFRDRRRALRHPPRGRARGGRQGRVPWCTTTACC